MLHDVAHFLLVEAEVDGHADAARAGAGEDGEQKTGGVVRDDGDALALGDSEAVQPGGELAASLGEVGESHLAPGGCWLVGFVYDGNAVGIDRLPPCQEVADAEGDFHAASLPFLRFCAQP